MCCSCRTRGFSLLHDPRVQGTVAAIEKKLIRDGFVLRYSTETGADGLPGTEGAFLACSFWLADNYAYAGRIEEADELFDRLLGLRNHLGLLSEEYEPSLKRQIGNFPQAFSHLALIFTAHIIESCRQGARQPTEEGCRQALKGRARPPSGPLLAESGLYDVQQLIERGTAFGGSARLPPLDSAWRILRTRNPSRRSPTAPAGRVSKPRLCPAR